MFVINNWSVVMKSSMVILLIASSTFLCASGCRPEESTRDKEKKKVIASALADNPTTTHCRLGLIGGKVQSWPIGPATLDTFVSKNAGKSIPEYQYRIFKSNHSPASPDARVVKGDNMIVHEDGGSVKLIHQGWRPTTLGGSFSRETDPMVLDGSDLFAKAEYRKSGVLIGTYYLFWISQGSLCEYRQPPSGKCRRLHFEYFLAGDSPDYLPPKEIVEIGEDGCPGNYQTDDGDGDEGLR
jgi:hypothetical protein